jgi:hypothetical protein
MRVSAVADWRHSVLIDVHELVEALLRKAPGVTTEAVDEGTAEYEGMEPVRPGRGGCARLAGHGKTAMKGLERGSISDRAVLACSVARRWLP